MKRVFNWTIAICSACLVHLGLFWAVGLAYPFSKDRATMRSERLEISYLDTRGQEESALVLQRISIFDPRPLLLPTDWNFASVQSVSDSIQEESPLFPEPEPLYQSEEGDFIERFGNSWESGEGIGESQMHFAFNWLEPIGRKFKKPFEGKRRGLSLLLRDLASGDVVKTSTVYNNEALDRIARWPDWRPTVFMVTVADSFVLPGVGILESSGYPEVDTLLLDLISSEGSGRWVLPDGSYLLEVGL